MKCSARFAAIPALTFSLFLATQANGSDDPLDHGKGHPPDATTGHETDSPTREIPLRAAVHLAMAEQKTCPVCGKPVGKNLSVNHEGLKVYFSSEECIEAFKKAPERFLVEVYLQVYPQQVQVKCPVTGNPIDPQVSAEFKGRRIYYCCASCDRRFRADPARYMAALAGAYTRQVHCPVTGEFIDPSVRLSPTSPVYLCCKGCIRRFERLLLDDTGQLDNAGDLHLEAGLLAHGLTVEDDLFVSLPEGQVRKRGQTHPLVHEGVRYQVRDPSFVETFKAQPDRYIQVLRNEVIELLGEKHLLYTCSVHPSVIQIGPGSCRVAGKDLVPIRSGSQSAPLQVEARRFQGSSASR